MDAWGIADGYEDTLGVWRPTPPATREALRKAMGGDTAEPSGNAAVPPVRVLREGQGARLPAPGELVLEDGTALPISDRLPPDLPPGYHDLRFDGGGMTRLIVSPGRCHLPPGLRDWGWAAQLYATRSAASWGIGDLGDLARLGRWSRALGARLLLINPLGAVTPVLPQQASPYDPSSRRYRNPLYLRVEDVPGAGLAGLDLDTLAGAGRALNAERRIDRDAVFRLKMEALTRLWSRFVGDPGFDRYCRAEGDALREFAVFCALAEHHGGGWPAWPAEHRRPDAPGVWRFAEARADRVRFHRWLQWLGDRQLAAAAAEIPVMQDLPIGVDPGGADAWAWQDLLADGASVGAPSDLYNQRGQDWGLPPFIPHRLRGAAYEPFVQTIRAALRHAGGLRIDHVMGLFRLFWVVRGWSPAEGAFVHYPADDLLAIVALESARARAVIVGEDLGTVAPGVRETLARHRVLSYRLLWFEPDPPARYPELALAAVTTHDLPTIAGLWSRSDVAAQRRLGLEPNESGFEAIREHLRALAGLAEDAPVGTVIERTHRLLAQAPSALVTATLDDALGVPERPNMPSTTSEWPNWSIALPVDLATLETTPLARTIAAELGRR
jgi:4-alpha-glucanotransferase